MRGTFISGASRPAGSGATPWEDTSERRHEAGSRGGEDPGVDPDLDEAESLGTCSGALAPDRRGPHPLPGGFAYVDATLTDGNWLALFRLRYAGSASWWGFAIYRASHDDCQQAVLPDGWPSGTPEDALDTACGLYLGDPTAWQPDPRRINGGCLLADDIRGWVETWNEDPKPFTWHKSAEEILDRLAGYCGAINK